jgi:hypothetical protein
MTFKDKKKKKKADFVVVGAFEKGGYSKMIWDEGTWRGKRAGGNTCICHLVSVHSFVILGWESHGDQVGGYVCAHTPDQRGVSVYVMNCCRIVTIVWLNAVVTFIFVFVVSILTCQIQVGAKFLINVSVLVTGHQSTDLSEDH